MSVAGKLHALKFLMDSSGYHIDEYGWPSRSGTHYISSSPGPSTIEDARREIERLEERLSMLKENPWGNVSLTPFQSELFISRLLQAFCKVEEVMDCIRKESIAVAPEQVAEAKDQKSKNERIGFKPGRPSEAAIERAKELLPIVERLYELTMQRHKPLMNHKPEACLRTALDILEDDPSTYSPISKSDLTPDLFTQNTSSARRDFVGQLLQRLLRKEAIEVSNYQALYEKIRNN
jgi:hypothetical protein